MGRMKLPNTPSIRRMPTYLHKLMLLRAQGEAFVSAPKLADYMNLDSIVVRKDLELTDIKGQPGVGYDTHRLIEAIRRFLGWDAPCRACLIGAGSLGSALLGYEEFAEYRMQICGVFDIDSAKIGTCVHGHEILDANEMGAWVRREKPDVAILCVPSAYAQRVTDELVDCGVRAFWNFANVSLQVPEDVVVQREVIAGGFAMLSVKMAHRGIKDG